MPVSVLIPTKNEEANLAECLTALKWSDDVVIVDSKSTDRTREIGEAFGARVVEFCWNGEFPKKKNWSIENVNWKNEWLLIVDADEIIVPELRDEIMAAVRSTEHDGYYINRRFMFFGKWIRHCGYYPSWNLRLFRHAKGRYEKLHVGDSNSGDNEVHEHLLVNGPIGHLKSDMLHFAYPDVNTWVEKHNRYSNWEAKVEVDGLVVGGSQVAAPIAGRRKLRQLSRRLPCRPALRFIYAYVFKLGILDGLVGFRFCRLLAFYEFLSLIKAAELRNKRASNTILSKNR